MRLALSAANPGRLIARRPKGALRGLQSRVTHAVVFLFAVLGTTACFAAPAELMEELRAAAAAEGEIALGELVAFKDTYLADITIQTPRIADDGSIAGTATFAGSDAPVLLQYVEGPSGGVGKWLLAWRLPTQKLGQFIPAVGDIAGQGVQMATPIIIFSRDRVTVLSTPMTAPVRDFYREVYGVVIFRFQFKTA